MPEQIPVTFKSKTDEAKVVEILVTKRPVGWGRRSVAPYFNEKCGQEMKQVLDAMMQDKKPVLFSYSDFQKSHGLNKHSLYLRINQGIRYVLEVLDNHERKYGKFMSMCKVRKQYGVGVLLSMRPECRGDFISDFKPKPVDYADDEPRWKLKMHNWLQDVDSSDRFLHEGLMLSPEEIEDLKATLDSVPGIMHSVTSYSVKIIKTNVPPTSK